MSSLLITNDFPPKIGGIQTYLGELWRRLAPTDPIVLAPTVSGSEQHDQTFPAEIIRLPQKVLLPTPAVVRRVKELIRERQPSMVFIDPIMPLGLIGPRLGVPYIVLGHGAEISGYARIQPSRAGVVRVLKQSSGAVVSGSFPSSIITAIEPIPVLSIPPGVDANRFHPLSWEERNRARERWGISAEATVVLGLSRLVPRKGFDRLIQAVAQVPEAVCVIAGAGRDRSRLERIAEPLGDRVRFLGRVPEPELPALYGAADVFAMLCRDRWGGVEAEGFGIVFLEAAACGVPSIAGRSGGAHEAVLDGITGRVVDPNNAEEIASALTSLVRDRELRSQYGDAARTRAVKSFDYDELVAPLARLALGDLSVFDRSPA